MGSLWRYQLMVTHPKRDLLVSHIQVKTHNNVVSMARRVPNK